MVQGSETVAGNGGEQALPMPEPVGNPLRDSDTSAGMFLDSCTAATYWYLLYAVRTEPLQIAEARGGLG